MKVPSVLVCVLASSVAMAEDLSVLSATVMAPLAGLEAQANANLPVDLDRRRQKVRCIDTFLIKANCNVDHHVWRDGQLSLAARDGKIIVTQAVRARATVRGRGEVARHIRETIKGRAVFTIMARPSMAPNWMPRLDLDVDFRWTHRPTAKVLGFIELSFGGEAEKALNDAIARFKRDTLPGELAKLKLRDEMAQLWQQVQDPLPLTLPQSDPLFLHIHPLEIGLSPIRTENARLSVTASLTARTRVTEDAVSPFGAPTSLPDLAKPKPDGVDIRLPVSVSYAALSERVTDTLPRAFGAGGFDIGVTRVAFSGGQGRLSVDLDVTIDRSGARIYAGRLKAQMAPLWDRATAQLDFSDLTFERTGGVSNAVIVALANSQALRGLLSDAATVSFKQHIAAAEQAIDDALNRDITPDFRLVSRLHLDIVELDAGQRLTLHTAAVGTLGLEGFALGQ